MTRNDAFKNQTVNDGVPHSKNPRKCAYHVTFDLDLDLDLEHTLDVRWPGVHSILWKFGGIIICLREEAICLKVYRRTDRRTDDGRLAIVLAHSWNELIKIEKWPILYFYSHTSETTLENVNSG